MNAKITYCYNYWQIYKNPCEIAAHKKRLRSKVAVSKKISLKVDALSRREQFFLQCLQSTCSHELRIYNVFGRYLKGIELIRNSSCSHPLDEWLVFYYERTIAATHSFKFTLFLHNITRVIIVSHLFFL